MLMNSVVQKYLCAVEIAGQVIAWCGTERFSAAHPTHFNIVPPLPVFPDVDEGLIV
jgi:hypothetical protein